MDVDSEGMGTVSLQLAIPRVSKTISACLNMCIGYIHTCRYISACVGSGSMDMPLRCHGGTKDHNLNCQSVLKPT